ncbi:MAG: clan AA aspartic protease [Planctomycetes bacterium]|nr:clan AA aspartic protease [Planctomycetota bacterium]
MDAPQQSVTLSCLADTGATDTVFPADVLDRLGMPRAHRREYELADGRTVSMDIGFGLLEFEGERTTADIVFGEPGTEPILGVTALESTGFVVDPRSRTLRKRAIRL